jgi:hypothetical protein
MDTTFIHCIKKTIEEGLTGITSSDWLIAIVTLTGALITAIMIQKQISTSRQQYRQDRNIERAKNVSDVVDQYRALRKKLESEERSILKVAIKVAHEGKVKSIQIRSSHPSPPLEQEIAEVDLKIQIYAPEASTSFRSLKESMNTYHDAMDSTEFYDLTNLIEAVKLVNSKPPYDILRALPVMKLCDIQARSYLENMNTVEKTLINLATELAAGKIINT